MGAIWKTGFKLNRSYGNRPSNDTSHRSAKASGASSQQAAVENIDSNQKSVSGARMSVGFSSGKRRGSTLQE